MKVNNVVSIVTPAGEFVGRFKSQDDLSIVLDNPRALIQTQEGMGFAPSICATAEVTGEVSFNKNLVVFTLNTSSEVESAWQKVTSGLVL